MIALIYMTPYYNTNLQLNLLYWCKEIVHPKIKMSWKFPLQAFQDTYAMFWSYDILIMEMCHQSILKKKKLHTTYLSSFYQIFILSQGWTLWHSWSKSRAFAAVGKCTRSENPAQEMRTLLVYWSVPYKILTECTLIADMKGASIHTYIRLTWKEKRNMEPTEESIYPGPTHLRKTRQGTMICSNAFN